MTRATRDWMENENTILIVDDDVDFQFMVTSWLQTSGYRVKSLLEGSIPGVLEMAKKCELILLDIELPGTSGVELSKALKSFPVTMGIPVIMLSAHSDSDKMFVESHANALIPKPFSLSRLMLKIKELLSAKGHPYPNADSQPSVLPPT